MSDTLSFSRTLPENEAGQLAWQIVTFRLSLHRMTLYFRNVWVVLASNKNRKSCGFFYPLTPIHSLRRVDIIGVEPFLSLRNCSDI